MDVILTLLPQSIITQTITTVLQGVVDANYWGFYICIGWPGSVHDARVFAHSPLYTKVTEKELLPNKTLTVNGMELPLYLIGDSAYPL